MIYIRCVCIYRRRIAEGNLRKLVLLEAGNYVIPALGQVN